jgi:hypothetical protein
MTRDLSDVLEAAFLSSAAVLTQRLADDELVNSIGSRNVVDARYTVALSMTWIARAVIESRISWR